ncbi:ATP-binding protein [Erwinia sorbitola]|uniref:histidine kinase n=1 Tax=Erwinia sorbitola TaxID=2681984 RepID=A0A6I6EZP6_9GAMM|nr:transporter substrate-binding domain-containing protein [Erwinia sorbitola]QGU87140.1 transporter substrate-binding domain-containing protein [Erwinia sorbitola]
MNILSWLLLFVIACMVHGAAAQEPLKLLARSQQAIANPGLSASEWRWVREHRKIRLAVWLPMSPPYDITTGLNDYGGINADFIGLAADNLGIEMEVIRYENYDEALAALRTGKADFIARASDNQRNQGLILSHPYSPNVAVEVVNNAAIRNDTVRKVAIAPGYDPQRVQQRYPQAEIVSFNSPRHALEALAFRKVDLFFCDSVTAGYLVSQSSISNLMIHPLTTPFPVSGFSFAAMPQMQTWINVLNKVMLALPESASVGIHRRWKGGITLSLSEQQPVYTSLEHKWINEHKRIRVAVAEDNPPVAFFDESGKLRGIIADVLTALQLRTGFTFVIQRYPGQRAALKAVKAGKEDLVAGVTQEDIWRSELLTTRTWLYNSWVMVGRAQHVPGAVNPGILSLDGQSPEEWLRKQSGGQPEKVDTWRHGLNRMVLGNGEMMAMPLIVANTLLENKEYASLRILGSIDIDSMRFSFGASRQSWPLIAILNKALINIPPEDLHALTRGGNAGNSFASNRSKQVALNGALMVAVVAALLLTLVAGCCYRRQQSHQRRMLAIVAAQRKARKRAASASRAKSAFLTTMSHEIRTPVSAILGMLELVMKRPGEVQQNRESVRIAWEAAQALLLLIGNILDVSRIESGRLVLRPERASLIKLIEEPAMLFEGMAAQKGLMFVLELDADLQLDVLVDRSRFRQILVNLAGNAIKFTERGQITLRVQLDGCDDGYLLLHIEVEDTGEGIDEATRVRLFRPFAQGNSQNVAQGSGLGLYICRTLAQMMGGSIDLNSEPGKGTRVTVRLKLPVMAGLPAGSVLQPATPEPCASLVVLIVDDNPAGRMQLRQQLSWLGHQVISAESPKVALEKLEHTRPDAVITDCNMPGISGFELAHIIHMQYPGVPVFGSTADAREAVREEAREAGMRDCLFKPMTLNMLSDLLATVSSPVPNPDIPQRAMTDKLPPELLKGENLALFLSLQISVLDETLARLRAWHDAPDTSLRETLHKLRGGIQLLGVPALVAACEMQEAAPDSEGVRSLEAQLIQLRVVLQEWHDTR